MDKLIFACNWDKDRLRSWSGTHYSLFKSLKKYFQVYDLDSGFYGTKSIQTLGSFMRKVVYHVYKQDSKRIAAEEQIRSMMIRKELKFLDTCQKMLQFEVFPQLDGKDQYLYQDMYWGHLKKIFYNQPDLFKMSGFAHHPENDILEHERRQAKCYRSVSGIFTMSHWMARELVEEYGISHSKVYHVGGGSNIDVTKIDDSQKTGNKFLFVGRDFERKNGPLVIKAFEKVYQEHPSYRLYIAGPQKLEFSCPGVVFLGDLSYQALLKYFNLCDVFCMPSRFEAYGLVFAEALIFGLPCIGRDAYEMPYFIDDGNTGYLLKHESVDELAELMEKLIQDTRIRKQVINNRNSYLNEYSWDSVAKRISEVMKKNYVG